jgi:hypothetical protein
VLATGRKAFRFSAATDGFQGVHPDHGLTAKLGARGVLVARSLQGGEGIRIGLGAVGRPDHPGPARSPSAPPRVACTGSTSTAPSACAERIEYQRGAVTEWWETRPEGFEQGFTITERPAGGGALVLELAVGDATTELIDATSAVFTATDGFSVRYSGLSAVDRGGRRLDARFAEARNGLSIEVDDRGAVYPVVVDPIVTPATWTVTGGQSGARFGSAAASAGDVNGDGYADLVVGAPSYDGGGTDTGRAYVYLGSPAGSASSPAWTVDGDQAGAGFGSAVAGAGDVNGDGYADVLVSAKSYSAGETAEGRVYLYLGSANGLTTSPSWVIDGDQTNAAFGDSIDGAGDVNGDGYADVIVGAPGYDNGQTDEGGAFLYFGSASGLTTTAAWTAESDAATSRFGDAVAGAGDTNGDGYADVIVGSPGYDNGQTDEGRALLFLGSSGGLATNPVWSVESNDASGALGNGVAGIGDVNGDGHGDVAVVLPNTDSVGLGRGYVYYGTAAGLAASSAWSARVYDGLAVLAAAGDVNSDGYADLLLGAGRLTNLEGASVFFGGPTGLPGETTPSWTIAGVQAGAGLGTVAAAAGDVDGDGRADIAVASPLYDGSLTDEGQVAIFHGASGVPTSTAVWAVDSGQGGARFASSLSPAGDVNGDGYGDIIVGAQAYDNGQLEEGRAWVYFGSSAGLSTSAGWRPPDTDRTNTHLGISVNGAGDVNGDGYSDVIVETSAQDTGTEMYVYQGSASGLPQTAAWTKAGLATGGHGVGDVNGDGYSDIEVRGAVYSGSPSGLATSPGWTVVGAVAAGDVNGDGYSDMMLRNGKSIAFYAGSAVGPSSTATSTLTAPAGSTTSFGDYVTAAGDINGDGYGDIAVGEPNYANRQAAEGRVLVYLGSASGISANPSALIESNVIDRRLGSVASAGDLNGDGYADLLITGTPNESDVWAYLGSATGLKITPAWTATNPQGSSGFGNCMTAGDVNGDGYSDVLIGAQFYGISPSNDGRAFVYLGAGGDSVPILRPAPHARRPGTSTPVHPLGRSPSTAFDARFTARTPYGRGKVRVEVETKLLGAAFDGAGTAMTAWTDSGLGGASLLQPIGGLASDSAYHWRARALFKGGPAWGQGHSRWLYGGILGSARGVHFRTSCADSDSDGTCDSSDQCPNEPAPTSDGCPAGSGGMGGGSGSGGMGGAASGGMASGGGGSGGAASGGTASGGGTGGGVAMTGGSSGTGSEGGNAGEGGSAEPATGGTSASGSGGTSSVSTGGRAGESAQGDAGESGASGASEAGASNAGEGGDANTGGKASGGASGGPTAGGAGKTPGQSGSRRDNGGCGCRLAGSADSRAGLASSWLLALALLRRRRPARARA